MRTLIAFTLAAALVGTTGCHRKHHGAAGAGSAKPAHLSAAAAAHARDVAIDHKLRVYVRCLNDLAGRFHDSEHRYYSWVDKKTGPTGKEPAVYGLDMVNPPGYCASTVVKAKAEKPSLPELEKAGDEYVAAAEKGYPIVKEASRYYSEKDYKDDNMFKGKQLHPKLVAVFAQFDKARQDLQTQVDRVTRQLDERKLAWFLKNEGRKIPYLEMHARLLAQDVRNLGYKPKLDEIDVPKFAAKVDDFEKAMNALSDYAGAHRSEAEHYMQVPFFLDHAKDFLLKAKDLRRRLRDKTGNGSPEQLRWAYFALAKNHDRLRERLQPPD